MELYGIFWDRELLPGEEQALLSLLPPQERQRAENLWNTARRQESLMAYGLLALVLRQRCGLRELPETARTDRGKPFFPDHPEIFFSISHTKGAALVGVADGAIGVDVEHVRTVGKRTMERLGEGLTEQQFLRTWVRREARAKRSGTGLAEAMREELPMEESEQYRELSVPEGFFAGVSFSGEDRDIKFHRRRIEDLIL